MPIIANPLCANKSKQVSNNHILARIYATKKLKRHIEQSFGYVPTPKTDFPYWRGFNFKMNFLFVLKFLGVF